MGRIMIDFELENDEVFVSRTKNGYMFVYKDKNGKLREYPIKTSDLANMSKARQEEYLSSSVFLICKCAVCKKYYFVIKNASSTKNSKERMWDYEITLPFEPKSYRNVRCIDHPRKIEQCEEC